MDERLSRFKYCDPRLVPHVERVLARLPSGIREEILNDRGFQIISDAALPQVCGRGFVFEPPAEYLLYLNPAILMQPDHRLECSVALELAEYALKKDKKTETPQALQHLLIDWGFQKEVDAVCFCSAISGSKAFKSGYEWARRQDEEYLMLHFGIYFDEWNRHGLGQMSDDLLQKLRSRIPQNRLLPTASPAGDQELPEGLSLDQVLLEGIMAAVKEFKLRDQVRD